MQALWVICRLFIRYRWKVVGVFGLLQICCCCLVAVVSDPLRLHGPYPTRLLCSWDCPGKNTGVSCHFLLQGIFLTQGSNLPLLHWQADCLPLNHQGRPYCRSAVAAAAAKSLQWCLTLCNPIDGSPPGSPVPGILQARILEWVTISFSNAWKWKVKVKSLSRVPLFVTPCTAAYQAPPSMGFSRPTGL